MHDPVYNLTGKLLRSEPLNCPGLIRSRETHETFEAHQEVWEAENRLARARYDLERALERDAEAKTQGGANAR